MARIPSGFFGEVFEALFPNARKQTQSAVSPLTDTTGAQQPASLPVRQPMPDAVSMLFPQDELARRKKNVGMFGTNIFA